MHWYNFRQTCFIISAQLMEEMVEDYHHPRSSMPQPRLQEWGWGSPRTRDRMWQEPGLARGCSSGWRWRRGQYLVCWPGTFGPSGETVIRRVSNFWMIEDVQLNHLSFQVCIMKNILAETLYCLTQRYNWTKFLLFLLFWNFRHNVSKWANYWRIGFFSFLLLKFSLNYYTWEWILAFILFTIKDFL